MYHIESIDVFVRSLLPDRMNFALGRAGEAEQPAAARKRRARGVLVVRLRLADERGRSSWGAAADRPSFGWFDKRPQFSSEQKLSRLFALVERARDAYLAQPAVSTPFQQWRDRLPEVLAAGERLGHESLSANFASSLMERALIDAVCRMEGLSVFEALRQERLGFDPGAVFDELQGVRLSQLLRPRPRTSFLIRHTVGLADPLVSSDVPASERIADGLPQTLSEYVRADGLRCFKIKIAGNPEADLDRLGRIWSVIQQAPQPLVTLDGNEAYRDLDAFARFVEQFEQRHTGLFQHVAFIEQPLTRALTHDRATSQTVARIARRKSLLIDEADGAVEAFRSAHAIGYHGVSHKNCKGFFKSLLNFCLCRKRTQNDQIAFQSGEDLSTMPLVALQQDYAALGVLDIAHCERNGHHYHWGLRHLTDGERAAAARHHQDLYTGAGHQMRLNIRAGRVDCRSLQAPGFGVRFEPDWGALTPLADWTPLW